jgi:hypothetical protein
LSLLHHALDTFYGLARILNCMKVKYYKIPKFYILIFAWKLKCKKIKGWECEMEDEMLMKCMKHEMKGVSSTKYNEENNKAREY